jgi:hypothetical protein
MQQKSQAQRTHEVMEIARKFVSLGIPVRDGQEVPGIAKLMAIAREFVRDGIGASGKIRVPEYGGLLIMYKFSNRACVPSDVTLRRSDTKQN